MPEGVSAGAGHARITKGPADLPLPDGFLLGHATRARGDTGCTVVVCPAGTRGGVDVRGGGTGTRELTPLCTLANAEGPSAVLLSGGSAFGLAAADGVMRWLEQRGLGRQTPIGLVPLVPAAVVFDRTAGEPDQRPGPDDGYAACDDARPGVPERGAVGAGAGAAVGKLLGRDRATSSGIGYAALRLLGDTTVAAIVVANAFGDVLAEDGTVLGGPQGQRGELLRSAELICQMAELREPPAWTVRPGQSTTLACVCTDAPLDKRGCGIVARVASAGIARAVDPVFTPNDGDVVFCLASGTEPPPPPGSANSWMLTVLGTAAASAVAAAIRDAVAPRAAERADASLLPR
ncbi:MAG: P1 family peptidase [Solirubrobacteraceae bacterium]